MSIYLICGLQKKGIGLPDTKPLVTYSVKENKLIKTIIPQKGIRCLVIMPDHSYVKFGNHPMARSIKELDISETAIPADIGNPC